MRALLVHYLQTDAKQSLQNNALFLFSRAIWMHNAVLVGRARACVGRDWTFDSSLQH
jgi:hypothetical protein